MTDLKTTLNTLNHKDIAYRALKTGAVVFLVTLGGSLANLAHMPSLSDAEKLLFAAAAAAGTAILNYGIQLATPHISPQAPIVKQ
jgi:hypothetical protein